MYSGIVKLVSREPFGHQALVLYMLIFFAEPKVTEKPQRIATEDCKCVN